MASGKSARFRACVCANAIPAESLQRGAPRPEAEALSSVEGYRNQAAEQQKRNGIRRTRLRFDERKLCMPNF